MTKEESYLSTAQQLLELVGGKENVVSAAHCATRLRLVLKDESRANVEEILKLDLVKGQFASGGQFQIITRCTSASSRWRSCLSPPKARSKRTLTRK